MNQREARNSEMGSPGDLCGSVDSYSAELGRWWYGRAENPSHRYAYRNVAAYIRGSLGRSPRLIMDYACGPGHLLTLLSRRFPRSCLMGLDGSSFLLDRARRRIARLPHRAARRISLIPILLPDFTIQSGTADLVVYTFPNLVIPFADSGSDLCECHLGRGDIMTAESLARASDPGEAQPEQDVDALRVGLLVSRLVSFNLRSLLRRGGLCIRVEYATARRDELTRTEYMRVAFEEGSLDIAVDGYLPWSWFRVLASSFFRSRVMEDVYQQTADEHDRSGGYVVTTLRAL